MEETREETRQSLAAWAELLVVEANTGRPIGGAHVTLLDGTGPDAIAETSALGRARIALDSPDATEVTVRAPGFVPVRVRLVPFSTVTAVILREAPLGLRVVEAETGAAVAGATVATLEPGSDRLRELGRTDAEGRWRGVLPSGWCLLSVGAAGFEKRSLDVRPGHGEDEIVCELAALPRFILRVAAREGPPPEELVFLDALETTQSRRCGLRARRLRREGNVVVYDVAARPGRALLLRAPACADACVRVPNAPGEEQTVLLLPEAPILVLAAASDGGAPRGTVTWSRSVRDPAVGFFDVERRVPLDAEGRAWLHGVPSKGRIQLVLRDEDGRPLAVRRDVDVEEVVAGGGVVRLEVHREPSRPVELSVVSAADGRPIPGATVTVRGRFAGDVAWTDRSGRALVEVPSDGSVLVEARGWCQAELPAASISGPEATIALDAGGGISGCVVDERGKPVSFALVRASCFDGAFRSWTTRCDEDGRFVLAGLCVAQVDLLAERPDAAPTVGGTVRASVGSDVVLFSPRLAQVEVQLRVDRPPPAWSVRIADPQDVAGIARSVSVPAGVRRTVVRVPVGVSCVQVVLGDRFPRTVAVSPDPMRVTRVWVDAAAEVEVVLEASTQVAAEADGSGLVVRMRPEGCARGYERLVDLDADGSVRVALPPGRYRFELLAADGARLGVVTESVTAPRRLRLGDSRR